MFRRSSQALRIVTFILIVSMLLAACGGDGDGDATATDDAGQVDPTATMAQTADATPADDATPAGATATEGDDGETDTGGEPVVLSYDAGATGGGSGQANAPLIAYCYVVTGGAMFEVSRLVDSRLFAWTADMSDYVPEIAEEWEIDEAGTTITFHLRENAMWHDGTPVTANDVLFTFNLIAHPDVGSRYASTFNAVEGYEELQSGAAEAMSGLTAPDDHTVVLTLAQPDSAILPGIPVFDILPAHLLGDVPLAEICENSFWVDGRVGSGPFKWKQLVEGQRIELEAFDDYFLGRPQIDEINLLFFASAETSLAAFEQQSSMAAPLTADNLEYAEALEFATIEAMSTGVLLILPNTDMPEFSDPRVRQAMRYAIDAETIAETLFKGVAAVPTSRNMPWLAWAGSPDMMEYSYDPERAQELLGEADWDASKEFTLWYYYPDQVSASVVEAIQQYWAAVGINVELRLDEGGARQAAIDDGTLAMQYGAWAINPPSAMSTLWACDSASYGYPCIEEFDELIEQARVTFDEEEQRRLYQEAIKIQAEQMASVFLWDRIGLVIQNEQLNTNGHSAWSAARTYHNFAEEWTLAE